MNILRFVHEKKTLSAKVSYRYFTGKSPLIGISNIAIYQQKKGCRLQAIGETATTSCCVFLQYRLIIGVVRIEVCPTVHPVVIGGKSSNVAYIVHAVNSFKTKRLSATGCLLAAYSRHLYCRDSESISEEASSYTLLPDCDKK